MTVRQGLLALALAALVQPLPALAEPDPDIVGLWELQQEATPFNQGVVSVFELRADGTYSFHDIASGHAGTYDADGGQWSLQSATSTWTDAGDYSITDDGLALTGRFGPSAWRRFDRPLYFTTETINGQPIPVYLDAVVAQTWADVARPWRPDSIPVSYLEARAGAGGEFTVRMHFLSPKSKEGLVVDVSKFVRQVFEQPGPVDWPDRAMPLDFIDLPQVIAILQGEGRPGPYRSLTFEDNHPGWGWSETGSPVDGHDIVWITEDGQISHEPNWEYIDEYNEAWDRALAPLHALFGLNNPFAGLGCPDGDWYCHTQRTHARTACEMSGDRYSPTGGCY